MNLKHFILAMVMIATSQTVMGQNMSRKLLQNPFKYYRQKPILAEVHIGTMAYWGDLSDNAGHVQPRPSVAANAYLYLLPFWSVRAGFVYGSVSADDKTSYIPTHLARNLHFRSNVFEFNTMMLYELWGNPHLAIGGRKRRTIFSPYLAIGGAFYRFNPKAEYNGQWHELQPLGTEGQFISNGSNQNEIEGAYPEPYKRTQFAIPMGGGFRYYASKRITFGVEALARKLFTDYLDDVSTVYPDQSILAKTQNGYLATKLSDRVDTRIRSDVKGTGAPRGNSKYHDYYYTISISMSWYVNQDATQKPKAKK